MSISQASQNDELLCTTTSEIWNENHLKNIDKTMDNIAMRIILEIEKEKEETK